MFLSLVPDLFFSLRVFRRKMHFFLLMSLFSVSDFSFLVFVFCFFTPAFQRETPAPLASILLFSCQNCSFPMSLRLNPRVSTLDSSLSVPSRSVGLKRASPSRVSIFQHVCKHNSDACSLILPALSILLSIATRSPSSWRVLRAQGHE